MITLLHNFSISPISWLVKKIVVLYSLFILFIKVLIFSLTTGSSPIVGSSKKRISGLGIKLNYSQVKTPTVKPSNPDTPVISTSFAEDTWETIAENVQNGNTSNYHVCDTKIVSIKNYGLHTVRIANMSTPDECKTEGFSQTACGFVVEFTDVVTKYSMNASGEYKGTTYYCYRLNTPSSVDTFTFTIS